MRTDVQEPSTDTAYIETTNLDALTLETLDRRCRTRSYKGSLPIGSYIITPEFADAIVGKGHGRRNKANRKIKPKYINKYAEAMKHGQWVLNGDTLKFDTHGKLLDGQNRLRAVLRTGISIPSVVVFGLDPSIWVTMDVGKTRNSGDFLQIAGCENAAQAASILRWVMLLQEEEKPHRAISYAQQDILDYYENHVSYSRLQQGVSWAGKVAKNYSHYISRSQIGALYYVMASVNEEEPEAFFEEWQNGRKSLELFLSLLSGFKQKNRGPAFEFATANIVIVAWRYFVSDRSRGLKRDLEKAAVTTQSLLEI